MKSLLKILTWAIAGITAFILVLFLVSILLRDRVADIFLRSVNRRIETRVDVGEYRLSLIRKFPRATVELRNLTVMSSTDFDRKQFRGVNTDTLLTARSAFLEFSMTDILRGNYSIESISIEGGRLNLYSDNQGNVNYEITSDTSGRSDSDLVINLEKIIVSALHTRYINTATSLDIAGLLDDGKIRSRISGSSIDFTCNAGVKLSRIRLFSADVKTEASMNIELALHESDSGFFFRKGVLRLDNFRFGITGSVSSDDNIDLKITGHDIDLGKIRKYLPEKYLTTYMEYSPQGILKTECRIKGPLSRRQSPGIEIDFSLDKGKVRYSRSDISVTDLSFSGYYSNGRLKSPESTSLSIENAGFRLGSASYSASLRLSRFPSPEVDFTATGDLIPGEVIKFIKLPDIRRAMGSARVNLNLRGRLQKKDKYTLEDFISLNPEANIQFSDFGFFLKNGLSVTDADGTVMFAKNLWAEDLLFTFMDQRFRITGEFFNLPAWLAGQPVRIRAVADISAGNFKPASLLPDSSAMGKGKPGSFRLPEDIEARVTFRADNMEYRDFGADKISGEMIYRPGRVDFKSLEIHALGGTTVGEFFLARSSSESFLAQGKFNINRVDVHSAFLAFRNFGQDFIKAENLAGELSGNVSILIPLDSMLKPDIKSITAEGRYILENGALTGFEPVKALSDFIELSELENISFSTLENDLFISNNYLALPQMDIKSSAADFSVNGRHSFDNNYEYHVRAYLSELLSKKARRNKGITSEFGAIEEDGLGRTNIYLKVTGMGDDIKVAYDLKAAGSSIKQSLRNEKGNLKSILNQEYGWFKGDTAVKREIAPRPRFRILFEDIDTAGAARDTVTTGVGKGINRIFKKKKGQAP